MHNVLKWDDNHQPLTYNQVGFINQKLLIHFYRKFKRKMGKEINYFWNNNPRILSIK